MGLDLVVPGVSRVSRRQQQLGVAIRRSQPREEGRPVSGEPTGFKVFGEGEWKVRQHGFSNPGARSTWAWPTDTHEVVAVLGDDERRR
ncbi:MAG: hypothetical protein ACREXK_08685 [Gammaproteobacteria bacterium]